MTYKIRVSGNLKFQRSVGMISPTYRKDFDQIQLESFADVSDIYDGGKIKFLHDWADSIDSIEASVHKINYYLASEKGLAIGEGLTLNHAEVSDVGENPAKLIVNYGGRLCCEYTLGFSIEVGFVSSCDEAFTRSCVQEAARQVLGNAIDLHTFDGVEVMGEPELNVTIVNN